MLWDNMVEISNKKLSLDQARDKIKRKFRAGSCQDYGYDQQLK